MSLLVESPLLHILKYYSMVCDHLPIFGTSKILPLQPCLGSVRLSVVNTLSHCQALSLCLVDHRRALIVALLRTRITTLTR